ncbi:Burnettramic acids biosynthesis cluster protein E [Cladobotryum mycophilum]|uniref:Burnettramic acids biosynthesis cluster protein E n=1 Tax=Cladobotryum mycophilum TaxID=491253 RepID=A0ABR0SVQ1_9HYPO
MPRHRDHSSQQGNGDYYGDSSDPQGARNRGPARRKGPISSLVRGVAAGIGLASESYHHYQEKKQEKKQAEAAATDNTRDGPGEGHDGLHPPQSLEGASDQDGPSDFDGEDEHVSQEALRELDEAAWQLDDAQFELAPPPDYATATQHDADDMAHEFLSRHPIPEQQTSDRQQLPVPVIIPQRRPGERARGFIHAYAPTLGDVGIDQWTFMDFIKQLNTATMPSPWINAINVASLAVQHVPEPVTIAVSIAAQIATQVSLQAHSRSKTNTFLNKMNADFFRPLGLIAVILTWKPSKPGEVVTQARFDAALETAASNVSESQPGIRNKMQASNATTNFEWPESAPLVFPNLDKLATTAEGREMIDEAAAAAAEKKPNGGARGMIFAMEYMDKRAQAQWAADHPTSGLANLGVEPEFHSRFSDPNHPASSGSLIALLTGGAIGGRGGRRQARRERRNDQRAARREEKGPTLLGTIGPLALIRSAKKLMHEDVLYLMIANMPSTEQMATAQRFLNTQPIQNAIA